MRGCMMRDLSQRLPQRMKRIADITFLEDGIQLLGYVGPHCKIARLIVLIGAGSVGSVVLIRALLKGMGREVECDVMARKLPYETGKTVSSLHAYSDCNILTAPSDLPDGEYVLHVDEQVIPVLRRNGHWF